MRRALWNGSWSPLSAVLCAAAAVASFASGAFLIAVVFLVLVAVQITPVVTGPERRGRRPQEPRHPEPPAAFHVSRARERRRR